MEFQLSYSKAETTLPKKVRLVKAMVFPVVMYGCEIWTTKKTECWRIDAFELWCWRNSWESLGLQGDQTSQSSMKSVLNIYWKDWCWSWNSNILATWCEELTPWKRPWWWERLKAGREEDDLGSDGCHHKLDGHQFEKAPGVGDGQGSLMYCHPRGRKESDMSEQLNWLMSSLDLYQ